MHGSIEKVAKKRRRKKPPPREETRLIRYTSGGRRQAQSIIRSQSCLGIHLAAFLLEDVWYIYIYTPIEAKSFVTNRLSTDDPGCSTKFRKFRATPCGIIPPPPLSLTLSPPYREDALIDTRSRRSLNCPRRSFYLHLGKCYTSRCCLISRFQRYSRGGNFQSGASDRQLADPKRSINRS